MNKKLMAVLAISLFAVTLVTAGYIVNSFVLTTDIYEPFTVEYAIIGDGSTWDGVTYCDDYTGAWMSGVDVDVGGLYAGESRYVCTRITNAGEANVDYTFSGEVISGNGNLVECEAAFGNPSKSGYVAGLTTLTDGVAVELADSASPVDDCQITLSVARG